MSQVAISNCDISVRKKVSSSDALVMQGLYALKGRILCSSHLAREGVDHQEHSVLGTLRMLIEQQTVRTGAAHILCRS
jgi:hypothetical protein